MDFKSLLQSFDTLSEAETKQTKTGRVHKGDYGNSYDAGEEGTPKSADAPKKGRGRPKKGADDSGEVKSYDTKSLGSVFGGGQKPKKEIGKVSKKHSLKEYMESAEATKEAEAVMEGLFGGVDHTSVAGNLGKLAKVINSVQTPEQFAVAQKYAQRMSGTIMKHQHDNSGFGSGLKANLGVMRDIQADLKAKAAELGIQYNAIEEDMNSQAPIQVKPASQTNTQVIQQGNKTLGTVNNPQLAAQIKQSIGKGEMTLNPDEEQGMTEGKFSHNAKTGEKLDPRTGEPTGKFMPGYGPKPARAPRAPSAPKLTLDTIWRKVEQVVAKIYPDGEPMDWLLPWFDKQGIDDYKVSDILARAARKNGYKDIYDYWKQFDEQMKAQAKYDKQGMMEGSHFGNEKLAKSKEGRGGERTVVDQDGKGGTKSTTTKLPTKKKDVAKQGVDEGKDQGKPGKNFAKIAKSAGKEYGSKAAGERVAGAVKAKLAKQGKLEEAKDSDTNFGSTVSKGSWVVHKDGKLVKRFKTHGGAKAYAAANGGTAASSEFFADKFGSKKVDEAAKPDFLDMDKDGNKKETFKKAVKDKAKKKVDESISIAESPETLQHIIGKYKHEVKNFIHSEELDHDLYEALFDYYFNAGEMPYGTAKGRTGDPYEWVSQRFSQDVHDHVVDEGAREDFAQHAPNIKPSKFIQVPAKQEPTPWKVDPINAATDRAYNFISNLRKQKTFEGDDMKDVQFESWEKQLNGLLNEGITVSTSTGQQGAPDSVSINATDADAEQLLQVLRGAGVGVFGGDEKPEIGYGVAQGGEEEPDGTGTEPQMSPDVVGDGDDMLALIKKMSGIGGEEPKAQGDDYEDEEGSDEQQGTLEPASDDEEEQDSGEEDSAEDEDGEEEVTDEGNAFTGKLKQTPKGGEFKMGDKSYKDTSSIEEGDDMCETCHQDPCGCSDEDEQVEESWSNDAGGDAEGGAELMKLKALLSMGNDLHKMKRSQSVGNPTQVAFESQVNDWKKLSGI